jgi:hypothetical protein
MSGLCRMGKTCGDALYSVDELKVLTTLRSVEASVGSVRNRLLS